MAKKPSEKTLSLLQAAIAQQSSTSVPTGYYKFSSDPWKNTKSEMYYQNTGKTVPDIELGEVMGPVETAGTVKGILELGATLATKTAVKAPFLVPRKFKNSSGMEILRFRTAPAIDIDKVNPARHIGGTATEISLDEVKARVKKLSETWGGPWELYETPGGYRALYTGKKRARPIEFFDDQGVKEAVGDVIDRDYVTYSKSSGEYGVRISPKRAIEEPPGTRPSRTGAVLEDDFIARKIETIGDGPADPRARLVLKYMHDKPIAKYNAGKKTAAEPTLQPPTDRVIRARTRGGQDSEKILAELDNINERGGLTDREYEFVRNISTDLTNASDQELAVASNILARRTGATQERVDTFLGIEGDSFVRELRQQNHDTFLRERGLINNYGEQTPVQAALKTESTRRQGPRPIEQRDFQIPDDTYSEEAETIANAAAVRRSSGLPVDDLKKAVFEPTPVKESKEVYEKAYDKAKIEIRKKEEWQKNLQRQRRASAAGGPDEDLYVPPGVTPVRYTDLKKGIGKDPEVSDVLEYSFKMNLEDAHGNTTHMIQTALPGQRKRVMLVEPLYTGVPSAQRRSVQIVETAENGEKVRLSFYMEQSKVGGNPYRTIHDFGLFSDKAGDDNTPFRMLSELPKWLPKADHISFGSLSEDSAAILLKGLTKEMKRNPKKWDMLGYRSFTPVNGLGRNTAIAKNYKFLQEVIAQVYNPGGRPISRSTMKVSDDLWDFVMNTAEGGTLKTEIGKINDFVGQEVLRVTKEKGLEYRGPEVKKLLPAILVHLGISANKQRGNDETRK